MAVEMLILHPLVDLMYPPFVMMGARLVFGLLSLLQRHTAFFFRWGGNHNGVESKAPSIASRKLTILKEQWGDGFVVHSKTTGSNQTNDTTNPPPPDTTTKLPPYSPPSTTPSKTATSIYLTAKWGVVTATMATVLVSKRSASSANTIRTTRDFT